MELKKMEINGVQVEFVNTSRGTRYGFAHDTVLFIDGAQRAEATCHYLNRTWERYTYQSVMRKAVYELAERLEERLRDTFKAERGYAKMTAKRQAEFAEVLNGNETIRFYRAVLDALA